MKIKDYRDAQNYYAKDDRGDSTGAFKNFVREPRSMDQEPRNMYSQGQLVQNTVDGSRPGYSGLDVAKRKLAFDALEKVIEDDELVEIKKLARKIDVPATTVQRVFDENFIGKGILKKSKGADAVIDKIIESGVTDLDEINQIAKDTYKVNLSDRVIQAKINKTTDLSIAEYEQIFRKMAADRTYEPPIDISAKGKGKGLATTANYIKAKENLKIEIPQIQKLIQQNSDKRKKIKLKKKIEADPVLKIKNLVDKQIRKDKKRFNEKGKIGLSNREVDLNTQQRLLIKEANELINANPDALLKDTKLLDKISWRVDGEGNLYKSKPDLTQVLNPKSDSRFFHLSHSRRAELGTQLTDAPVNRFVAPFSTNNEFIKDAETFIEKNLDHPKVKDILKKAEELKITLRPDVPLGTFKNTKGNPVRYVGYTENINDPVGKIKTVIDEYMPKELKPKFNVPASKSGTELLSQLEKLELSKKAFGDFWCNTKQIVKKAGGGRIGFSGSCSVEVKQKNFLRMTNDVATGKVTGEAAEKIAQNAGKVVAKVGSKSALASIFGPAGILFDVAYEVGSIGWDVAKGKPFNEALRDNWITGAFIKETGSEAFHKRLAKINPGAAVYGQAQDLVVSYDKMAKKIERMKADTTYRGKALAKEQIPLLEKQMKEMETNYNTLTRDNKAMEEGSPEHESYMRNVTELRAADRAKSFVGTGIKRMDVEPDRYKPLEEMKIDFSLPQNYTTFKPTLPTIEDLNKIWKDEGYKGTLPTDRAKEFITEEKWRQEFEQPGIRGTQDWRGATGGLAGLMKKYYD